MAKGKPSKAFLEALQHDKRKRGDESSGGGFQTPQWFFNGKQPETPAVQATPTPAAGPGTMALGPIAPRQSQFRLTWAHGLVVGLLLIAVLATVYTVKRGGLSAVPKVSDSSEKVKDPPVQAGALDVEGRSSAAKLPPPPLIPAGASQANAVRPLGAIDPVQPNGRTVGLNYVVMQAFENDAKAMDAATALQAAGIGCTIEKNHPYNKAGVLVIGTQGFAKTSAPEYQQYIAKVMQVSTKYSGTSKWRKLEPNAYKWK